MLNRVFIFLIKTPNKRGKFILKLKPRRKGGNVCFGGNSVEIFSELAQKVITEKPLGNAAPAPTVKAEPQSKEKQMDDKNVNTSLLELLCFGPGLREGIAGRRCLFYVDPRGETDALGGFFHKVHRITSLSCLLQQTRIFYKKWFPGSQEFHP
jgi:hypothetical protein